VVLLAPAMLQAQGPANRLYSEHCALCHGATGDGGAGPDLTSPAWHASVSDSDIDRVIARGRGAMPRFGDTLDAPARKDLIDHLRSLQAQAIQPTTTARAPRIEVGSEALLLADENDAEWLMYGRDYGHQRRSPSSRSAKKTFATWCQPGAFRRERRTAWKRRLCWSTA
jgi:Cytochrome C oxidase, cbb3-type, subunit III